MSAISVLKKAGPPGGERHIADQVQRFAAPEHLSTDRLLRQITEGTAAATGEEFMRTLSRTLAESLGVRYAFVGELVGPARGRVKVISLWNGMEHAEPFEYALEGTPCSVAVGQVECFYTRGVQDRFPQDDGLVRLGVDCYLGIRLQSSKGEPFGLLAIMHTRELEREATARSVLRIFAARASAELERLQVTRALKQSEQRFAKVFRCSPVAALISRLADGKLIDANDAACELLGYTRQEMAGRSTRELGIWVDATDRERVVRTLQETGTVRGIEHLVRHQSGETRLVQNWLERIELDGEACIVGSLVDVTDARNSAQALRDSEAQLRLVTENIPAAVAYTGRDLIVRFANRRYQELIVGTGAGAVGRHARDIVEEKAWPQLRERIAAVYRGESVDYQRTVQRADGTQREIEVHFQPNRQDNGEIVGHYTFVLDITERRRSEEALRESEAQFKNLTELSSDYYWEQDDQYRFVQRISSGHDERLYCHRYSTEDVIGKTRWELPAVNKTEADWVKHREDLDARREFRDFVLDRPLPCGKRRVISTSGRPIFDHEGRFTGYRGVGKDITKQTIAEEALRLRNRALEASVNAIMITDALSKDNPIVYVNPAFERNSGYTESEVLGRNPRFLLGTDTEQPALETLRAARRENREAVALVRNYTKNGTLFWNELRIAPVRDTLGSVTHFVSVQSDVTERVRYETELERQANFDSLTGLANRNLLTDRLRQTIVRAERAGRVGAVLLLDLDRFKMINDSLGHTIGDRVLSQIGLRLSAAVRGDDTVARTGGDEFVVVLADVADENDVAIVAQKLLGAIASPLSVEGHDFLLTTSIGIAVFPRDGSDPETLLKHADVALYRSKERGRGCVAFFAREMNERAVNYFNLERDLRRALERSEFVLHYQAIVSVASGEIVGAEALIRWQRESGQMVSPLDFIPVAEESGLIVPVGAWVLGEAVAQASRWNRDGARRLSVAVNLSARQFRDPGLVAMVRDALSATGLDPRLLKLEITESTVMQNPEEAIAALRALRALGVKLSVDDFGTGYSSLSYLKRLPLDNLKVDRSFVRGIPGDRDDVAITHAVIELAHSLGLQVVAEGVESDEQRRFLIAQGCDYAQGYLFSKPVNVEAFDSLIAESDKNR